MPGRANVELHNLQEKGQKIQMKKNCLKLYCSSFHIDTCAKTLHRVQPFCAFFFLPFFSFNEPQNT